MGLLHQLGLILQTSERGIHVLDHELQDCCAVRTRLSTSLTKDRYGLGATDGQGGSRRDDLGELRAKSLGGLASHHLAEGTIA